MTLEIPNYRIVEKLGEGAQTHVYRARRMQTGKDYAVKIVKVVKPEDNSFIDLLRSEHQIGTAIDHPVIRKVYELRILRQRLRVRGAILFMEYVPGLPLSDRAFHRSLGDLLALFRLAAEGLQAMHIGGFVHADLKPSNMLVMQDERLKLIDLGQSSVIREAKAKVQGTIDYMAPEQAQRGVLDARTDVFGLGAALHRVITGKPVATEMNQNINLHSQGLVGKRVDQVRQPTMEDLPPCVSRLITDSCHTDPADRLADMLAMTERIDLARVILAKQESGGSATTDSSGHSQASGAGLESSESLGDAIAHDLDIDDVDDDSVDCESWNGPSGDD